MWKIAGQCAVMIAVAAVLLSPVAELSAQTEGPLTVEPRRPRPTRSERPPREPDELPVLKRSPKVPIPEAEPIEASSEAGGPCPAGYIAVPKNIPEEDEEPPRLVRRDAPPPKEAAKKAAEPEEIEYECVFSGTIVTDAGSVPQENFDPFLEKVREQVFRFTEGLPNFICDQLTTRLRSSKTPPEWQYRDRVSAEVLYVDGKESYRNLRKNGRPLKNNPEDSGAWSTGEFGTLMLDVFHPTTAAAFEPDGYSQIRGFRTKLYKFSVKQENSHWHVTFAGEEVVPAYDGRVWIDPGSMRPLRIEMAAKDLPTDYPMDTVETMVEYGPVKIADKPYLLVTSAETLTCQRGSPYCSKNEIALRNYRKFAAESTISTTESTVTFEGATEPPKEDEKKKP